MRFAIFFMLISMLMSTFAASDFDREQIQQRISPVGQVNVQEPQTAPSNASPPQPEKQAVAKKVSGQDTYEKYCVVCHRDGVAGAPKFRDEADWKTRMAAAGNIDGLLAVAIKGLNAMPAKGTCSECSDAELKAAIQYMVPQS